MDMHTTTLTSRISLLSAVIAPSRDRDCSHPLSDRSGPGQSQCVSTLAHRVGRKDRRRIHGQVKVQQAQYLPHEPQTHSPQRMHTMGYGGGLACGPESVAPVGEMPRSTVMKDWSAAICSAPPGWPPIAIWSSTASKHSPRCSSCRTCAQPDWMSRTAEHKHVRTRK